ncbi:hypothetical protein ACLESO_02620 [Pyxidicoccus sp. 3LG]
MRTELQQKDPTHTRKLATVASRKTVLVPPEVGRLRFDGIRTLWLWGMLVPGVAVGLPSSTPTRVAVSLGLTFATLCLGHSVGLHRSVIHRAYEAGPWVRGVLAYLFVLSGLGGPLSWARLHAVRDYWQSARTAHPTSLMGTRWRATSSGTCTCASSPPTTAP